MFKQNLQFPRILGGINCCCFMAQRLEALWINGWEVSPRNFIV